MKRLIDRILSKSLFHQISFVIGLAACVLGVLITLRWILSNDMQHHDFQNWILHFINPGTFYDTSAEITDRYWALLTGFFGMICLGGILISVFNNIIARRVEKVQNGQINYLFKNHYVIIGYDGMAASIIKQMYKEDKGKDIVVQTTQKVTEVRRQLEIDLDKKEMKQVIFLHGASNSKEDLHKLCLHNALRMIILGDDDTEAHDAMNMECMERIVAMLPQPMDGKQPVQKECDVLFRNQSTYAILQKIEIDKRWRDKILFRPFNFYETWAQKVIVHAKTDNGKIHYPTLDRTERFWCEAATPQHNQVKEGIRYESDKTVHFVIMGMNRMGIALAIEAARTMHFPNSLRDNRLKTHITFVDPNAGQEMNFFISRYPHLFELVDFDYTDVTLQSPETQSFEPYKNTELKFTGFTDIRFSFVKGRFESPQVRNLLSGWTKDNTTILTIGVCIDDLAQSIATGLYLPPDVFTREIPVLIQQKATTCLFTQMTIHDSKYKNVRPFGMINECFSMKEIAREEALAMRIMWVYNTFHHYRAPIENDGMGLDSATALQKTKEDTIDSEALLKEKWQKTIVAKRWSNIYNAFSIPVKDRSFGFSAKEISEDAFRQLAEVEHNRWNIERLILGYRATTKAENEVIYENRKHKDYYRENLFAHIDIRPFDKLISDSYGICADEFDICLSECLPKISYEQ